MNKKMIGLSLVLVLLLSLTAVTSFAQGGNPPENRGQGGQGVQFEVLADYLELSIEEIEVRLNDGATLSELFEEAGMEVPYYGVENSNLADVLGITLEELQTRLDAGETLADLHAEAGLDMFSFEMNFRFDNEEDTQKLNKNLNQNRVNAEALGMTQEQMQEHLNEYFGEFFGEAGMPMPGFGRGVDGSLMNNQQGESQGLGKGGGRGSDVPSK